MNKIVKFFCDIAMKWWCFWSNIRHPNNEKDIEFLESDWISSYLDVKSVAYRIDKKFVYTTDGPDELWDCIVSPPECYVRLKNGELRDDCDGFHSAMHYFLSRSGIEAYLFCVAAKGASHCLCIFNLNGKWHVGDYTTIYKGYDNVKDAIDAYIKIFPNKYNAKSDVYYYGIVNFDYTNNRFYFIDSKKFIK